MAKLDMKDALFHFRRNDAGFGDMFGFYAFDSGTGPAPTFSEIETHVRTRGPAVPALNLVLREALLNLDFPSWVPTSWTTGDRMSDHDMAGAGWSECQLLVAAFLETRLDARSRPWHVHVIRGVTDVPMVRGSATVVVLQVSHALTDGLGLSRISAALFAPASASADTVGGRLPGHRASSPNTSSVAAALSRTFGAIAAVLSIPFALARYRHAHVRARRRYLARRGAVATTKKPGIATRFTAAPTDRRSVLITPLPASLLRALDVSVTAAALSSVASAMTKYMEGHGDPPPQALGATVPVAIGPDVEWPSANRVVTGIVDLHADERDPRVRARAIAVSLREERTRLASPELLAFVRAEEHLPAVVLSISRWIQNRRSSTLPAERYSHTSLVSVDRGPATLELCGGSVAFTAGASMLPDDRSVVHGFFGMGDVIALVLHTCPDTMPDRDYYATLLIESLEELARLEK
jgi:diacylglycerol O-acyltransferase